MNFAPLSRDLIVAAIAELRTRHFQHASLVLTDGTSIVVPLDSRLDVEEKTGLRFQTMSIKYEFPYSIVSGIGGWQVGQNCFPDDRFSAWHQELLAPWEEPSGEFAEFRLYYAFEKFLKNRARLVSAQQGQQQIQQLQPVEFGPIEFTADTPIYCDWSYLSRKSGGLNSIGAGFGLVSFSAGWNSSLWSSFRSCVNRTATSIAQVIEGEATVYGHATLLVGEQVQSLEMEGGTWIPIVLTEKKVASRDDLDSTAWLIALIQRDHSTLPLDLWEKVAAPIRFYGEVLPIQLSTEFGSTKVVLKMRAAAHMEGK